LAAEPATPLPFSTEVVTSRGRGARDPRLIPKATSRAFSGEFTSGWTKSRTAAAMFSEDAESSFVPVRPSILDWNTWPLGKPWAKYT
jgi:hypothetical protein